MQNISRFKCPYIERHDIWKSAEEFRTQHWPERTLPIDIETIVEKRLKLDIAPAHGLHDELDIEAYLRRDLTGIVVDCKRYMDERFMNPLRFSYAHELGHLMLHKDIYTKFPIDNLEEWKRFILDVPDREYGFIEYQANEFAGRVLVPRELLISELDKCVSQLEEAGLLDYFATNPAAVLSSISPTLCKPFGVSDTVIEIRVDREGLWPPRNRTAQCQRC
jgi:hypothetical protein